MSIIPYNKTLNKIMAKGKAVEAVMFKGNLVWPEDVTPAFYILDHIQSTGTQYINTELKYDNANYSFETNLHFIGTMQNRGAVGVGSTEPYSRCFINRNIRANNYLSIFCMEPGETRPNIFSNRDYPVICTPEKVELVGEITYAKTGATTDLTNDFLLGSQSTNGVAYSPGYMKLKTLTIKHFYEDRVLGEFIPCEMPDGTLGMYDTVTKSVRTNAGTGTFIAGARIGFIDTNGRIHYYEQSVESPASLLMTSEAVADLGIEPTNSTESNMKLLEEMEVSL